MKNKSIILLTSFSLAFSVAVGVATLSNSETKEAAAIGNYSTDASTYYSGITATSGEQLAGQLHDLITSTHRYYTSYADNGANGYQKNTDRYYENDSPVSGYIYEFYSGVKWPDGWYPEAGKTNGGYNREHCWCQSNSVNNSGTQMWGKTGGGSDMHHIRPVESRLNSTRSNNVYGEISNRDSSKVYAKLGNDSTYALGGYNNGGTFEPLDSKKGDVARIILYTYLHYNSYSVSEFFGGYAKTNGSGSSSYFSSSLLSLTKITNQNSEAKALEMLLSWNESDPVDDIETRRNNQVAVYQGNRNPFIDNSDYAERIWGSGSSSTAKVNSVSVSPSSLQLDVSGTKTGELTADVSVSNGAPTTVTWSSSNENVATVNSSGVVTAVAKGSCTITATSTYNENKSASCSVKVINSSSGGGGGGSSNNYELFSGSLVEGNYIIYYSGKAMNTTVSGSRLQYESVTPSNNIITTTDSSIVWHIAPSGDYWTIYNEAAKKYAASTGTKSQAQLLASGTENMSLWTVTGSSTFEFVNKHNSSNNVNANLRENSTYGFACYSTSTGGALSLYKQQEGGTTGPTLKNISLNTSNVQTEFVVGDTFDYSGLFVVATYDDETEDIVTPTDVSTPDMSTAGDKTVTVSYTEGGVTKTNTYTITVSEPEPTVDSVELDVHELELDLYGTASSTLSAEVIGENNPPQDITWESSDTSVATVSDAGVVTAVAVGECTIKAYSTYDDEHFDTCTVTVTDSTPSGDATTVTTNIGTYATAHSWANETKYTSITLDSVVTATATGGGNTGKYYTNGNNWRFYQGESATLTISLVEGYVLNSVCLTYAVEKTGILKYGDDTVASGSDFLVTGSSVTFTVGNSGSATNGQVRFTDISVTYSSEGEPELSSITLDTTNAKTSFVVGDTFTYAGLVVTANYTVGASKTVTPSSVSSPNMSTTGQKIVTVFYTEDSITKEANYTINVEEQTIDSIYAYLTDNPHCFVGDVITEDDITVEDGEGNEITGFDFAYPDGYLVTYEDARAGESSGDEVVLENAITYGSLKCDLGFSPMRQEYQIPTSVEDTMNKTWTGVTSTSYTPWSDKTSSSGAIYAGNSAGGNSSIQLKSKDSVSGIVTTAYSGSLNVTKITVTWNSNTLNGRTLDVYGKTTAYSAVTDLYSNNSETQGIKLGSIVKGTSTELYITGSYKYIGLRSKSDAMWLEDITITYGEVESALNVANFIMYKDTEGQCVTKFDQALEKLNDMSTTEKELFWNSDDYVISQARARLLEWARHEKVTLSFVDDEFVANSNKNISLLGAVDTSSSLIIVLVSLLSISSIAGYFLIKRKKEE